MHNCSQCPKKHSCDSELNTKDTLKAILKIFIMPFFLFLIGITIGVALFSKNEFRYLIGFMLGFMLIVLNFVVIRQPK